ncbi:translesion DNA synthesis-associated protein ImuA [Caldimonas thermodepolymerans]|uniref:Recombinase RecA n=1 Tax=Caldimonas thermodepolymerans TaxID=215580 RepID=A0A2S5T3M8_9BURK|nr:translesion DNA synthesis-associated protein ImuA [Caldimonas thermodepolymerans]PPE69595.1 recombinase RecA [Caldimonas thermodepolymerans]QPC30889.1 translesion DNA synthesis-associated protein ImuA [Caldimonas thermodepolymerans]RDH97107.1 protein ImuA [Caldimonas thermodepolymerans]
MSSTLALAPAEPASSSLSLPADVEALAERGRLWRGHQLGGAGARVLPTGHPVLDRELPGGGWPCQALTELLLPPGAGCEWRLLGPALRALAAEGGACVLVGAPAGLMPHAAGLALAGLDPARLVWVAPGTPEQALWAAEQALHCRDTAAVLLWLPQARVAALRRLQAHAQQADLPLFALRPQQAAQDSSLAPLRLAVAPGAWPWSLQVRVLKRRGPAHEGVLELPALPPRLAGVLAARLRSLAAPPAAPAPSAPNQEARDAVLAGPDRTALSVVA